ncbi:MAG: PD-(D/E)XK nuclease family protein [Bacteroidales bacterium]|nr:PD-(D/E)XK nuclease family protein [Bacteroidales bacterium]
MKQTFLSKLAESIIASGVALSDTLIVLPNKRAQRMLLREIAGHLDKPVFAPTIYTIEDFVEYLSPLRKMEQLELVVELYQVYKSYHTADEHNLNAFLSWGPAFLSDISDMDVQLQNCETTFKDFATEKSFEISFGQDAISVGQQEKIKFYALLSDLYQKFVQHLLYKNAGYPGLLYRDCAENMEEYAEKLTFKHCILAGFHVLSASELKIIRYVKEHCDTHFFFDVDPFYCDFQKGDKFTTAYFLKNICRELSLPSEKIVFNTPYFQETEKEIQIVGTSKSMNQIYYAIDQLEKIRSRQGNLNDTALVLADESLLLPLLTAYHPDDMNVTMGYPIKATPVYTLLNTLLDMYQTGLRYSHGAAGDAPMAFYHRDMMALMRHPLVKRYLFVEEGNPTAVIEDYDKNQRFLYQTSDIKEFLLPHYTMDTRKMLSETVSFLKLMLEKVDVENHKTMIATLVEELESVNNYLEPLMQEAQLLDFSTLKYAISQQVDGLTISLKGDASQGLQVMGLLETRTLDFQNVIMLSVNEGTLPTGIKYNSLLPFDFKYDNQTLQNYLYKDQVYAYHFFRLLQRAEHIILLYDNDSNGNLAEKSRFITQLEFEVKERHLSNIHLKYPVVSFPFVAEKNNSISVMKDEAVNQAVLDFTYSATSINDYIACPLKFYFKNICRIYRRDTFNDKIESNIIGTLTHHAFENVFNEIKLLQENKKRYADYKAVIEDYAKHVEAHVRQMLLDDKELKLQKHDLEYGRIFLAIQIIVKDVSHYLDKVHEELSGDTVSILGNELSVGFPMDVEGNSMYIKGSIDRLQKEDGHLKVVDYKTGKVNKDALKFQIPNFDEHSPKEVDEVKALLDEAVRDGQHYQFVQLLLYLLLCKYNTIVVGDDSQPQTFDVQNAVCGIVSIPDVNRKVDDYFCPVQIGPDKDNMTDRIPMKVLDIFEQVINKLLSEIYSSKTFEQCPDNSHCGYCDYKFICGR